MEKGEGGEGRRRRLGRSAATARGDPDRVGGAELEREGGLAPRRLSPFSFRWRKTLRLGFWQTVFPIVASEGGQGRWQFLGVCRAKSLLQGGGD